MSREYAVPPDDLMDLDRALAVVVTHDKAGAPWLIGAESAVLDRATRTVRYYAERTFQKELRSSGAPEAREPMTDPFQLRAMILDACKVFEHYDLPEHAFHYRRAVLGIG